MTEAGQGILKLKFTRRGRARDLVWVVALFASYGAFRIGLSSMIDTVSMATGLSHVAIRILMWLLSLPFLLTFLFVHHIAGGSAQKRDAARSVLAFVRSHGPIGTGLSFSRRVLNATDAGPNKRSKT